MLDSRIIIIGAVVSFVLSLRYLLLTLKGKVQPNRVTYFMWSLAPLVAFAAEIDAGVGLQSLMTFMVGFNPLTIFIASFFNAKAVWQLTRFDLGCGILSLVGLGLWLVTGEGNLAVFFAVLADGLAALPTLVKSYKYPDTEYWGSYFGGLFCAVLTLLTIKNWNFVTYAFPAYIVGMNSLIVGAIRFRPGVKFGRQS